MERFCQGCNGNSFSPEQDTWTYKSNLEQGSWTPWGNNVEAYGCGYACLNENSDHTLAKAWTVANNITPQNSDVYNTMPIKEKFCFFSSYPTINGTWNYQKAYTSN